MQRNTSYLFNIRLYALGFKLSDRIDQINDFKRKRSIRYIDAMADQPELEFHREDSNLHNYHILVAKVTNAKRNIFISQMAESGIQCIGQYYILNRQQLYNKSGYGEADCPNTDLFFDNMVSFPFQQMISNENFDWMLEKTQEILVSLR